MSKIGKAPINIPTGVEVALSGSNLTVKGPKGELARVIPSSIEITIEDSVLTVAARNKSNATQALWGTWRSHIANDIKGVTDGYEVHLEIEGVGFKAVPQGKNLELSLGFSHTVPVEAPEGIAFATEKNEIVVSGIDKQRVTQTAAEIRALKKPEPYKGKGIRYKGEVIRRKEGKKAVGSE